MTRSFNALPADSMTLTIGELAARQRPPHRLPKPPNLLAHAPAGYAGGKAGALGLGIGAAAVALPALAEGIGNLSRGYAWDGGARGERLAALDDEACRNIDNGAAGFASGGITAAARTARSGFTVPHDVVRHIGGGDLARGTHAFRHEASKRRPGHAHDLHAGPQPNGAYLLDAADVAAIGGGDHAAGLALLRHVVERSRRG